MPLLYRMVILQCYSFPRNFHDGLDHAFGKYCYPIVFNGCRSKCFWILLLKIRFQHFNKLVTTGIPRQYLLYDQGCGVLWSLGNPNDKHRKFIHSILPLVHVYNLQRVCLSWLQSSSRLCFHLGIIGNSFKKWWQLRLRNESTQTRKFDTQTILCYICGVDYTDCIEYYLGQLEVSSWVD